MKLLREAPVLHFASTTPDGAPVLRTVNPVVLDEGVYFHGSPAGEKTLCVGRAAVLQAEHVVATIPSYFVHPEKACPATTFYQSVQVHGTLERLDDPGRKALVLQELMRKFQREGGHTPITAQHPLYRAAVRGILVVGMSLERLSGKSKLGQNRTPDEIRQVLEGLWRRGAPGDLEAIELILQENARAEVPPLLRGPEGTRLVVRFGQEELREVLQLLDGQYWTQGADPELLGRAHQGAAGWVGARDSSGRLVASARAISDTARHAYVADVVVAPSMRGRGIGRAVVGLLLDHPALRHATHIRLGTSDAASFYAKFGFVPESELKLPFDVTPMIRRNDSRNPLR